MKRDGGARAGGSEQSSALMEGGAETETTSRSERRGSKWRSCSLMVRGGVKTARRTMVEGVEDAGEEG